MVRPIYGVIRALDAAAAQCELRAVACFMAELHDPYTLPATPSRMNTKHPHVRGLVAGRTVTTFEVATVTARPVGRPQVGHAVAASEILFPQSGQVNRAMGGRGLNPCAVRPHLNTRPRVGAAQ